MHGFKWDSHPLSRESRRGEGLPHMLGVLKGTNSLAARLVNLVPFCRTRPLTCCKLPGIRRWKPPLKLASTRTTPTPLVPWRCRMRRPGSFGVTNFGVVCVDFLKGMGLGVELSPGQLPVGPTDRRRDKSAAPPTGPAATDVAQLARESRYQCKQKIYHDLPDRKKHCSQGNSSLFLANNISTVFTVLGTVMEQCRPVGNDQE